MLEIGKKAPQFSLPNQAGDMVSLTDFLGKEVVLYFYSRDNTAGCSRQAVAFKELHAELEKQGAVLIGISKDSVASHAKFAAKYELPFTLLADPELVAIQAFDVWKEKRMYGKTAMGVVRSTYILDEIGTIIHVFPKAKPDTNAAEVLKFLQEG